MNNPNSVTTNVSVLWGDMDGFGHVNNIIYLKWCETARIKLFQNLWEYEVGNMEEILVKGGVGPILANFNMDYKHPVKYPDEIEIETYLTHLGNSSIGIGHELFSKKEKKLVAKGTSVVVMINYVSKEKVILGKSDREKLSEYLKK
ncbi:MAG: hypothetical protein BEU00_03380 [Marine Group III euryarchaeote CG-Epi3]|jgi:acyl-CoA thioester hydrolase|uniref:Thioesterase n=1 Tax=Marine Group III euryarchaeote CG-Epi3 TaxID=1888997 RepID=A0A1J5U4F6_9ARCH|nr:MAG: hypothetical protein BEU00_03380 [Marine Group III euryarchaeote CG-Epi3]|tara:strand:+ start:1275 stop:1712 length:438 start_codon:yes stop_codon:yes gene_type:complete